MKIEDCKTLSEFFGVECGDCIWVEGRKFDVYDLGLNGAGTTITQDNQALVGCLTGQLEWSKTEPTDEFGSCDSCGYEFNSELISEYEIEYCPKCGRKIEEIIVPAMTVDEENLLREIAAWFPGWDKMRLNADRNIEGIRESGELCAIGSVFGNAEIGSKAYTVLAPILEKHGEIDLDDYRREQQ